MKKRAYFDAAAAHPVRSSARAAFLKALTASGNPSAPHDEGREALGILERARTAIARETGAKSDAVVFTSGATESNALAILGHLRALRAAGKAYADMDLLYSPMQHASVLGAVEDARALGVRALPIPFKDGALDLAAVKSLLSERTVLVTLDVVCGETGTRHDTRAVRALIDELPVHARPVFHADATQAPLVENMERTRLGADLISFDAQKVGGVRGIGVLIAPQSVALAPLYGGGGQERGLRSGTPSPALAAAFARALADASRERARFCTRALRMRTRIEETLMGELDGVVVNAGAARVPHILNVSFLGRDTDYLAALLNEAGFAVSTRSACETDAEGSRVVLALTGDGARAASALRISFASSLREWDARALARAVVEAVRFLDAAA